ncbi:iron-regulated ABC-type transporter [Leifsonia xyli subsp. cynodontis DSM 46306]|uniref:GNAT family N-acetyltransferase n=1 Tax=Leifsonia xyli subsp. cynodontis DSM 46306 TaxID=1389489 RepID=U3PCS6_LEIXC|nr:hypothetical protein [Leifsonia xyli]AGW41323.1 iron-regulated ABC-type transporter [Leifsonia xyli subsp. cynodontis DSM 46306]
MTDKTDVIVESVGGDSWGTLKSVFGERGDAAGCWCQWFKISRTEWESESPEQKAERLHASLEAGSPGVLARLGGEPVGWAAVEPFSAFPALQRSSLTRRRDGDPEDPWVVTCFVVQPEHRQRVAVPLGGVRGGSPAQCDTGDHAAGTKIGGVSSQRSRVIAGVGTQVATEVSINFGSSVAGLLIPIVGSPLVVAVR